MLRELELQLAKMPDRQRAEVANAVRSFVSGGRALFSLVRMSPAALLKAFGQVQIWGTTNVPIAVGMERIRTAARKVGPHVAELVAAL